MRIDLHTARFGHLCIECRKTILAGEPTWNGCGVWEDSSGTKVFVVLRMCADCWQDWVALFERQVEGEGFVYFCPTCLEDHVEDLCEREIITDLDPLYEKWCITRQVGHA